MTLPPIPPADDDGEPVAGELIEWPDPPAAISPRMRTRIYVACLTLDVVATLAAGLAAVFGWLPSEQAGAALVLILAAIAAVGHALGVAYRPTRPGAPR